MHPKVGSTRATYAKKGFDLVILRFNLVKVGFDLTKPFIFWSCGCIFGENKREIAKLVARTCDSGLPNNPKRMLSEMYFQLLLSDVLFLVFLHYSCSRSA